MSRVAGWLDAALQKADSKTKAGLIQLLASLRNLQENYDASMALYRDAIQANPRDILAMNNLAYLISMKEGKHDEALQLLARAESISGPLLDLLDTKALVLLNKKDFAAARSLLEGVVVQSPSGPGYFHLAQVQLAAGEKLEAQRAWRKARDLGIKTADLHPLEQPAFRRLQQLFNP